MDNQNNIQDELKSLNSSLPVNNSPNPFSVPEGYFDGLAARILAKIKEQSFSAADELQELSPLLAGLSKKLPYTLPEDYFNKNIAGLSSFLKEEESSVLALVGKQLPYQVPQGYFESLPEQMVAKLTRPQAKVVPFFSRTWMRVAAAAVVGGILFVGSYQLLKSGEETAPTATAYQSADTTQNLVAKTDKTTVVQDIQKLSTKELDEFMSAVPVNPAKLQKTTTQLTEKTELKTLLEDVSEKEIDTFLEQIPTSDDDLFVID